VLERDYENQPKCSVAPAGEEADYVVIGSNSRVNPPYVADTYLADTAQTVKAQDNEVCGT